MWLAIAFYSLSCAAVWLCTLPFLIQMALCLAALLPLLALFRRLQRQQGWESLQLGREDRAILHTHSGAGQLVRVRRTRCYLGILILQLADGNELLLFLPALDQTSRWHARRLWREFVDG